MTAVLDDRFWSKVSLDGDCWSWQGSKTAGYGTFAVTRTGQRRAHRLSYEYLVADIPVGLVVDHLCRNRACVNPDHLDIVPPVVNTRRGDAARFRCDHPETPENTVYRPDGWRRCRACENQSQRERYDGETVTCEGCGRNVTRRNLRRHLKGKWHKKGAEMLAAALHAEEGGQDV